MISKGRLQKERKTFICALGPRPLLGNIIMDKQRYSKNEIILKKNQIFLYLHGHSKRMGKVLSQPSQTQFELGVTC